jgi:hypothetical protein
LNLDSEFKAEGYGKTEGESGVVEEKSRMRLKLDGFVYSPKFGYKVELGKRYRNCLVGNSGNVILDGVFFIILHLI